MAGDWIKMRCNLWTHPKIVTLASRLSVTRAHAIGALHGAWSVADQHGAHVEMTPDALDALVETPGLTKQLMEVGWLSIQDGVLQFLNYEQHNSSTAKKRACAQKRALSSRSRHAPVTQERDESALEKRREEKNKGDKSPLDPLAVELPFDSDAFRSAWADWVTHRKEKRQKLTSVSIKQQFADMKVMGEQRTIAAIRHTIGKGWTGIREPDGHAAQPKNAKLKELLGSEK